MPGPGVHTPITDEEAAAFAHRMLFRHPEISMTVPPVRWREYAARYFREEQGRDLGSKQWDIVGRGIDYIYERAPIAGVSVIPRWTPRATYFQYRDIATGRFISKAEAAARIARV